MLGVLLCSAIKCVSGLMMIIATGGYLALGEVLQEVILHDCLLDDGAGAEVLVVLGDVDVPGHRHALTRHALLLHQGCRGRSSTGLLQNKKQFGIELLEK